MADRERTDILGGRRQRQRLGDLAIGDGPAGRNLAQGLPDGPLYVHVDLDVIDGAASWGALGALPPRMSG